MLGTAPIPVPGTGTAPGTGIPALLVVTKSRDWITNKQIKIPTFANNCNSTEFGLSSLKSF